MSHREVYFPEKVARGASISPQYATTINRAGNGREVRNVEWSRGLTVVEFSAMLRDKPTIEEFIAFYRAVAKGAGYTFLFRDPSDLSAGIDLSDGSESAHDFAIGDGVTEVFPIYKIYTYDAYSESRRIQKPISAIKVYKDQVLQNSGYTVSYTAGTITFDTAPAFGVDIGWSGEFAIPVRFVGDKLELRMEATSAEVSGTMMEVVLPDA